MALDRLKSGEIRPYRAVRCNRGGIILSVGSLEGFLPFSLLDSTRLPSTTNRDDIKEACMTGVVGKELQVRGPRGLVGHRGG